MIAEARGRTGLRVHRALERRNRIVAVLRWVVPGAGLVLFSWALGHVVLATLFDRFEIARIALAPDGANLQAPEYSGVLADGSRYRVWAEAARIPFETPDRMELVDAAMILDRPGGVSSDVNAREARLEAGGRAVVIEGPARVEDSTGMRGTLERSVFDWQDQSLLSEGPIRLDYPDGTHLEAEGLAYDTETAVWTFSRVRVTLPDTPGSAPRPQDAP